MHKYMNHGETTSERGTGTSLARICLELVVPPRDVITRGQQLSSRENAPFRNVVAFSLPLLKKKYHDFENRVTRMRNENRVLSLTNSPYIFRCIFLFPFCIYVDTLVIGNWCFRFHKRVIIISSIKRSFLEYHGYLILRQINVSFIGDEDIVYIIFLQTATKENTR